MSPVADATTPAERAAEQIVQGQERVVGAAAWKLARRVRHLDVSRDQRVSIADSADPSAVLERLVAEFTSITGQLGARMCFMAAANVLREHPELDVPSFRPFRGFA